MNIFVSGGCKNGKSMYAQELAKEMAEQQKLPLYYLATMRPVDEEDMDRIARHQEERRGWGFETLEQSENICDCLEKAGVNRGGVFLLDSVTALLSNEMFKVDGTMDLAVVDRLKRELAEFAKKTGNTVFVSDYIYGEPRDYDEITEIYRKSLAALDRTLAQVCDRVVEVSYGARIEYKELDG